MTQAPIALTCGEPGGIGPEIAVKAWEHFGARLPFFWIGDPRHLPRGAPMREIARPEDAERASLHGLPVLPHAINGEAVPGRSDPADAIGIAGAIARAVVPTQAGEASAVCTAPIHRMALDDGTGAIFPGHAQYLAHLAGVDQVVAMMVCRDLRVVPATLHIPLSEVSATLTPRLLSDTIRITHRALVDDFGIRSPRLAVAGLNPHAGEDGAMEREETETIIPVIESLRDEGHAISGPFSGDTMFHAAARAGHDAAICMYHDQALIPVKTLDFANGVNVTLGLPFVHTSTAHGPAFDIAGTGRADASSLIAALEMAGDIARMRAA